MTRRLVESSQLAAVGYDPDAAILEIEFKPRKSGDRDVWEYFGVPDTVHKALMNAPSVGQTFGVCVKGVYSGRKVATIRADGTEVLL